MIAFYYYCVLVVLLVAGPILLFQKKVRAGFWQKLGFIPDSIQLQQASLKGGIWIHTVSVGEFNAVRPLIERLKETLPNKAILVSTTTLTGQTLARERVGDFAHVFYFPYDLPFASRRWLKTIEPSLVVIAETELWPGFVNECKQLDIPVMSVNGRMSPKSFKTYHRMRFFFGPVIRKLARLGVQSPAEASRYRAVGGDQIPISIVGNMKLDGLATIDDTAIDQLRRLVNVSASDFVVIAGSTHEGEETALLDAHKVLLQRFWDNAKGTPRPRLIIAPRHPERFERVFNTVSSYGFTVKRFSLKEKFERDEEVYIIDGLGQLARFYSIASVAFVGGTLVPVGGHSLVEPYAYSIATVCGTHVHKTRDIANALLELGALVMVEDKKALCTQLAAFQQDFEAARELGKKGRNWITENQGAVDRTLQLILDTLGTTGDVTVKQDSHNGVSVQPNLAGTNG